MMDKCLICGKEIITLKELFYHKEQFLCLRCLAKMELKLYEEEVHNHKLRYLNIYNEDTMSYLIKFKGLYDIRYKELLMPSLMQKVLKRKYKNYLLVAPPSWSEDDKIRGFNHVLALFDGIGIKIISPLYKNIQHKQSAKTAACRDLIKDVLSLKDEYKNFNFNEHKILLVDDVYTTGATISNCAKLIKVENYEILVCLYRRNMSK